MKNFKDLLNTISEHKSFDINKSKCIFVVGVPGSGKDVITRGIVSEFTVLELNHIQTYKLLTSDNVMESVCDYRVESIKTGSPILVTAPATDIDRILSINESMKSYGYETSMIFVNVTNETSIERNNKLDKVVEESVRFRKWSTSQQHIDVYKENFDHFIVFNNDRELRFQKQEIKHIHEDMKIFLGKDNKKLKKSCDKHQRHLLFDNKCPSCQMVRKSNKIDDVRDGDVASNSSYTFRTYEDKQPSITYAPEPKIPNFQLDKDSDAKQQKQLKKVQKNGVGSRIKTPGIGPEFDTRTNNGVYPMSGLGNVTYSEQKHFKDFRNKIKSEAIDDPGSNDMGVSGGSIGATNKEPMDTINSKILTSTVNKKKKVK